jgi:hypothetical protein
MVPFRVAVLQHRLRKCGSRSLTFATSSCVVFRYLVKVKVTLRLTVSQSVCLGVEPTLAFVARYYVLSEGFCLVSMECSLWWEDGSAICSAITERAELRRTRNDTLLSHLRLPLPGGSASLSSPLTTRTTMEEVFYPASTHPGMTFLTSERSPLRKCSHHNMTNW